MRRDQDAISLGDRGHFASRPGEKGIKLASETRRFVTIVFGVQGVSTSQRLPYHHSGSLPEHGIKPYVGVQAACELIRGNQLGFLHTRCDSMNFRATAVHLLEYVDHFPFQMHAIVENQICAGHEGHVPFTGLVCSPNLSQ